MPLERHVVVLSAQDQLSPTLKKAGAAADEMGRKGKRSSEDWERAATRLGAALGGVIGVTSKLGQAHQAESLQIRALERAYGDHADELEAVANSYQDMGIASDDAARIALLGAQTLTKSYGLTTDEIEQLLERSADLSQVTFDQYGNQLGLADVMQRVTAAIRGEAESAEILGVALNDQRLAALAAAEGMTGWNTTMTDAEKAAFRLKVFLEDTASAQGAAEERAESFAGQINALKLNMTDLASELGGALGPLGETTAVLGDVALAMPLVGAGAGKAAAAVGKLATTSFLGPAGLIAAAAAAGGALFLLARDSDDLAGAQERAQGRVDALTSSLADQATQLQALGLLEAAKAATDYFTAISEGSEQAEADLQTFQSELEQFELSTAATGQATAELVDGTVTLTDAYGQVGQILSQRTSDVLDYMGALSDGVITTQEMADAQAFLAGNFEAGKDTLDDYAKAFQDALGLAADPKYNGQAIIDNINAINRAVDEGILTEEQGLDLLQAISEERGHYNLVLAESEAAQGSLTRSTEELAEAERRVLDGVAQQVEARKAAWEASKQRQDEYLASLEALDAMAAQATTGLQEFGRGGADSTVILAAAADRTSALTAQMAALFATLQDTGAEGLDRTFDMIVGFTGDIANSVGTTRDWADALIAPVGVYSELDNLLASGKISLDEYNEAQQAQIDITDAAARSQTAANTIQAQNADLIADQAVATANYIEKLAGLPEAEQLVALAWQSTDIQGRANEIAGMAAEFDNMSTAQQGAFEEMITSAAATDPALAAVLEDLGLIKADVTDPTGWTISMGTSDAKSDIELLNETMVDFIRLFDPTYVANLDVDDKGAVAKAGIAAELFAYDNSTHTTDLDADTSEFYAALAAIPTSVGVRYLDIYPRYNDIYGGVGPHALGGITPWEGEAAALGRVSGGNMTLVGEHGPELALLPGGTTILPSHATMQRDDVRGGGGIHFHGDLHFHGVNSPQQFMQQMRSYTSAMERR